MKIMPIGRVEAGTRNSIMKQYHDRQMAFARTIATIKEYRKAGLDPHEHYPKIARECGLDSYNLYKREEDRIQKELDAGGVI